MTVTEKRIMAIDYGAKRVGIAVTDPLNIFAVPLVTLNNDSKLLQKIKEIITDKSVVKIVLGYPLKESGEKSSSTELVEEFLEKLKKAVNLEVVLVDERYSSEIAKERILASVPSRKKRRDKKAVDMRAAAVILEDYLNGGEF